MKAAIFLLAIMYDNAGMTSATVEIRDVLRGPNNAAECFKRAGPELAQLLSEGKDPKLTFTRCMTQEEFERFGVKL